MDFETIKRLLPGDAAPPLKTSINLLSGERTQPIIFNETTLVALWNAGCSGCLPAITKYSKAASDFGVPTYGVAVMVRNIERTMEMAKEHATGATLLLEHFDGQPTGLNRGEVSRAWLEASGQGSIPAAFIVDWHGKVVWMGPLDATITNVLKAIFEGSWDVEHERKTWLQQIPDNEVASLITEREITDALIASDMVRVAALIGDAERNRPEVANDKNFALNKLIYLAAAEAPQSKIVQHYRDCATRFSDDPIYVLTFTDRILANRNVVLQISDFIEKALGGVELQLHSDHENFVFPIRYHMTRARFSALCGDQNRRDKHIEELHRLGSQDKFKGLEKHIEEETVRLRSL